MNITFLPQKRICGRGFNGPYSKCLALKKITLGSYPSGKIWAIMYPYTHYYISYAEGICMTQGYFPLLGWNLVLVMGF
jgi:hypothetical protein